jgi:mRNA interferase RelE/StbE
LTYSVLLDPRAARPLKKLQRSIGNRIRTALAELAENPEKGEQLKSSQYWKLRVGDYRAIYEIDEASKRVIVVYVGHRKNVYDEFSRLL